MINNVTDCSVYVCAAAIDKMRILSYVSKPNRSNCLWCSCPVATR